MFFCSGPVLRRGDSNAVPHQGGRSSQRAADRQRMGGVVRGGRSRGHPARGRQPVGRLRRLGAARRREPLPRRVRRRLRHPGLPGALLRPLLDLRVHLRRRQGQLGAGAAGRDGAPAPAAGPVPRPQPHPRARPPAPTPAAPISARQQECAEYHSGTTGGCST